MALTIWSSRHHMHFCKGVPSAHTRCKYMHVLVHTAEADNGRCSTVSQPPPNSVGVPEVACKFAKMVRDLCRGRVLGMGVERPRRSALRRSLMRPSGGGYRMPPPTLDAPAASAESARGHPATNIGWREFTNLWPLIARQLDHLSCRAGGNGAASEGASALHCRSGPLSPGWRAPALVKPYPKTRPDGVGVEGAPPGSASTRSGLAVSYGIAVIRYREDAAGVPYQEQDEVFDIIPATEEMDEQADD